MSKLKLIPMLENAKFIEKDIALLRELCPTHKALERFSKYNEHTAQRIDGKILWALLDYTTDAVIIENRKEKPDEIVNLEDIVPTEETNEETVEEAKEETVEETNEETVKEANEEAVEEAKEETVEETNEETVEEEKTINDPVTKKKGALNSSSQISNGKKPETKK